jgi:hypothetical protein
MHETHHMHTILNHIEKWKEESRKTHQLALTGDINISLKYKNNARHFDHRFNFFKSTFKTAGHKLKMIINQCIVAASMENNLPKRGILDKLQYMLNYIVGPSRGVVLSIFCT